MGEHGLNLQVQKSIQATARRLRDRKGTIMQHLRITTRTHEKRFKKLISGRQHWMISNANPLDLQRTLTMFRQVVTAAGEDNMILMLDHQTGLSAIIVPKKAVNADALADALYGKGSIDATRHAEDFQDRDLIAFHGPDDPDWVMPLFIQRSIELFERCGLPV